ncbi:hypothetical protein C8Q76DRAFT_613684 [Earliella scabrosa]|nr:hypothetical protein C8Q76DRAFT_613684 [Earliella scabrosa]
MVCRVLIPAHTVLYWYDYLITLDQELELFWTGKITGATVLFFVNRYLSLFVTVYLFPWLPFSMNFKTCIGAIAEYLQYVPWAVFSSMRMFALGGQNWILTVVVLLLSIISSVIAVVRITLIIADILVLTVTWVATYKHSRNRHVLSFARTLLRDGESQCVSTTTLHTHTDMIMIHGAGTLYFLYVLAMNIQRGLLNRPSQRSAPAQLALLRHIVSRCEY